MTDSSGGTKKSPRGGALAVETLRLGREYRARRGPAVPALNDVSMEVEQGEVHGLLGPNGAGKSTLMKILSTVLLPTSGTGRVLGYDLATEHRRIRPLLGIVFGGERGLYPRLTARQNLRYWAALYGISATNGSRRTDALLEELGLSARADDRVETFSVGMRQRLHLARGIIGDPRVLLLDEPTNGLDPLAARQLRELIQRLAGEGRTVLIATHDLAEAEVLCDRVTMINHGRVVAAEAPKTLARLVHREERVRIRAGSSLLDEVRALPGVLGIRAADDGTSVVSAAHQEAVGRVLAFVVQHGVTEIRTELPSLEEVYLRLVHREETRSVVPR
ncbi:ABC transporter ATP-binding protein [Streptomyces sp. WA6-1-16]|uniref:ABC transporter ATP-binding protein n=1 Tax=Streptomyces sp. WA6-1-16 TaxID=2879427 RepID=UPI000A236C04|nr:ABC transporter ATP-binding protein [Streptomyces sp. WA6-1-16]OSC74745.1 ABC transporter [Streptomyces sp. BF-3]UCA51076.1 ABC transporter ATP-binding protein [Streptomyces sp. WA6-1-16]